MTNGVGGRRLFLGCFFALVATAFGFVVRAMILDDWRAEFNLSGEQIGYLVGAGLYPFAISIILFSLVVDRIGYGVSMVLAFAGHLASAVITIFAGNFSTLYLGTFLFALSNGIVEAVINPVVATIYDKQKTHYLSVLHAGWPGGLVLGGLLAMTLGTGDTLGGLSGDLWQWKVGLVVIPTVLYGFLLLGQKFPVQERVAAGVPYLDMLREFGAASCLIVCYLLVQGLDQILLVNQTALEPWMKVVLVVAPTAAFLYFVRSLGRPMFVFLMLIMMPLATTELGTDSWIADLMSYVLASPDAGALVLIYTSLIMFVLRFFAGPIIHRISPLGLLAVSALVAAAGLFWLSSAGQVASVVFLAATLYGVGKTFFWPATLGVVSESFPRGGALTLNAIAGVGMLAVGVLGGPLIGTFQDQAFDRLMKQEDQTLHAQVMTEKLGLLGRYNALDQSALGSLDQESRERVGKVVVVSKQGTLARIAVLPLIMLACYLILIAYFRSRGGYKPETIGSSGT